MATRKEPGVLKFFYRTFLSRKQKRKPGWLMTFWLLPKPTNVSFTPIAPVIRHFSPFPLFLFFPSLLLPPPPPSLHSVHQSPPTRRVIRTQNLTCEILWPRLNAHMTNINSDDPCLTKHFKFNQNKCCSCLKELVSPDMFSPVGGAWEIKTKTPHDGFGSPSPKCTSCLTMCAWTAWSQTSESLLCVTCKLWHLTELCTSAIWSY